MTSGAQNRGKTITTGRARTLNQAALPFAQADKMSATPKPAKTDTKGEEASTRPEQSAGRVRRSAVHGFFNGNKLFDVENETFADAGSVGVWIGDAL